MQISRGNFGLAINAEVIIQKWLVNEQGKIKTN